VKALSAAKDELRLREEATALETWEVDEAGWRKLVSLFRATKDNMRAQLVTLRFLKIDPNHESANVEMLKLLCDVQRYREAGERADVFLRIPSISADTLYEVSQCQIRMKRFEAAAATARRGIDTDATSFDARFSLAHALHMSGNSRAIRPHIEILTNMAGDNVRRWARVAQIAAWASDSHAIKQASSRVLGFETVPDSVLLQLGWTFLEVRSYANALIFLDRIDQAACKGPTIIQQTLQIVEGLIKANGPDRHSCDIGARAVRRLIQMHGPSPEFHSKLAGFENFAAR
jgi:tetratricopeptide (TPR) repeat protein